MSLCDEAGIGVSDKVDYLDINVRKSKQEARKGGTRQKEKVHAKNPSHYQTYGRDHMRKGINKVLWMGVVPGRVPNANALGMVPSQREVLRRQLASAAGGKRRQFLSHWSSKSTI